MPNSTPSLDRLIGERREEILAAWNRAARLLPRTAQPGRALLSDHVGPMLDGALAGGTIPLPERLDGSFDLGQVILEIEALRDCIKKLWHDEDEVAVPLRELGILDRTFDAAISESIQRYDRVRAAARDLAAVSHNKIAIRPANAGLLVSEVLATHAGLAADKGIRIRGIDELLGAELLCDRERIAQVFSSILGQAIKVCVSGDEILVRGVVGETEARFAISDPGPGISPEELPHVFASSGTNVGLYVSKGIIDAHAGNLWVESSVGDGTTFFFTLPIAR